MAQALLQGDVGGLPGASPPRTPPGFSPPRVTVEIKALVYGLWLSGFGQCSGMVIAENEQVAQEAVWYGRTRLCAFTALSPVLDIPDTDAARRQLVFADTRVGAPAQGLG